MTVTVFNAKSVQLQVFPCSKRKLVGGFNPFEKYARQIASFPQVGVKIKNLRNNWLLESVQLQVFPCSTRKH